MTLQQQRFHLPTGVELDVTMGGPRDGEALIFLHGFPESHRTWRHQLAALSDEYFVIAPDQRGYGRTSCPEKIEDYDMLHLTGDLTGMLDALGLEKAVFVGHDWGGLVVWQLPLVHPDLANLQNADGQALVSSRYMHDYFHETHFGIQVLWIYFIGVACAVYHFANGLWKQERAVWARR